MQPLPLRVAVPDENYHRSLVSCQAACPVHTDARGYVRAIAEGRFEEAYLIARGLCPRPIVQDTRPPVPALIAAFRPAQSPPLVKIPIRFFAITSLPH